MFGNVTVVIGNGKRRGEIAVMNGGIDKSNSTVEPPDVLIIDSIFVAQKSEISIAVRHSLSFVGKRCVGNAPQYGIACGKVENKKIILAVEIYGQCILSEFEGVSGAVGAEYDAVTVNESRIEIIVDVVGQTLVSG